MSLAATIPLTPAALAEFDFQCRQRLAWGGLRGDELDDAVDRDIKARRIYQTNAANLRDGQGTGVFPMFSRINHSCSPNVKWGVPHERTLITYALRDLQANEELFVDYAGGVPAGVSRTRALRDRGIICSCTQCLGKTKGVEEARETAKRRIRDALINANYFVAVDATAENLMVVTSELELLLTKLSLVQLGWMEKRVTSADAVIVKMVVQKAAKRLVDDGLVKEAEVSHIL